MDVDFFPLGLDGVRACGLKVLRACGFEGWRSYETIPEILV